MISIDDFEKFDLLVGEVKSAEKTGGALKLKIDCGNLTTGILEGGFDVKSLVGVNIVVARIPPTKVGGTTIECLIPTAEGEGGKPILLSVDRKAPNGSKIM